MRGIPAQIRRMPKILRRTVLIMSGLLAFLGFLISAKQCGSPDEFARWFFYWVILALALGAAVTLGYCLLSSSVGKRAEHDLMLEYQRGGWTPELADAAKKAYLFRSPHEAVLILFLRVMAEDYECAGSEALGICTEELEPRDLAAFRTCQLRRLLMTGQSRKAHSAFAADAQMLDDTYQFQPDFSGKFTPYAEDALVYFELAAAVCEREGQHVRAEQYALQAGLRISKFPAAQQPYLTEITALSRQYARAETAEDAEQAKNAETALKQRLIEDSALSSGVRSNLLRMLSQCRIFGSWTRETVMASKFERKLPPPEPEAPSGSNP